MTLLQKAVSPRLSRAYLTEGYDRVTGHVVRVTDVQFARSTTELAAVHGLHAPGSGWTPDAPWVDLLRFDAAWYLRYLGEPGFAVPLWWLLPTRVPPGAQLLRRYRDGGLELLARYGHLGTGWLPADRDVPPPTMAPLSVCSGPVALWGGQHLEADVVDGRVVVATSREPGDAAAFWAGAPGRWFRALDPTEVADVFTVDVTATWRDLPVRITDQCLRDGRQIARICPAGDDTESARTRGMAPLDCDVLERWVTLDELVDLRSQRVAAPSDAPWCPPTPAADQTLPVPQILPGAVNAGDPDIQGPAAPPA